jgi:hypothetical protein
MDGRIATTLMAFAEMALDNRFLVPKRGCHHIAVNLNSLGLLKFLADAYGCNDRQSVAIMGGHSVGSMDQLVRWMSRHY